jgi:hypothetical protein
MRRVRVHDIDAVLANHASKVPRGTRIDLAEGTAVDHGQPGRGGAHAQWLAVTRGDDRQVSTPIQLAGKPKRLTFTAAPAALRVDVQHSQTHGAQLPLFDQRTQGQRCTVLAMT